MSGVVSTHTLAHTLTHTGSHQCFGDIAFAVGRDPHTAVVTKVRARVRVRVRVSVRVWVWVWV